MYLMFNESEVRTLLKSLKKDKGEDYFLCKRLQNTLDEQKDIIGETHVTWTTDDIINEWNDRYGTVPSKETIETFIDSYIDNLNDIGGESAIECGWNIIYNAFNDYEKDIKE